MSDVGKKTTTGWTEVWLMTTDKQEVFDVSAPKRDTADQLTSSGTKEVDGFLQDDVSLSSGQ